MKNLAVFMLAVSLVACSGGGGGGSDSGTAPIILEVVLTDEFFVPTSSFYVGDQANFVVAATDPDLDMETLSVTQFVPSDAETPHEGPTDFLLPSQTDEAMEYYLIEAATITEPAGTYRIEFEITDAKGNDSNVFQVFAVVHEAV